MEQPHLPSAVSATAQLSGKFDFIRTHRSKQNLESQLLIYMVAFKHNLNWKTMKRSVKAPNWK